MAQLVFKCYYQKAGSSPEHRSNLVEYMATRDGAEFINDDNRGLPASKNQRQLIEQILRDVPDAKTLFEYEDYQRQPTVENASEFITQAMERALHESGNRDYYVKYIAERPRVEKTGSHGLFTQDEWPVALSRACAEIAEHPGNVWTPTGRRAGTGHVAGASAHDGVFTGLRGKFCKAAYG